MPASPELRATGKLGKPRYLVLGLDPGIASCGFALLDMENHEILEMGSRLFDTPVNPKNGVSLATARRGFRSTRRNLDRTQHRLKHNMILLKEYGVVPQDATKEYFHTTKGDQPPLALRVKALDEALAPREWALVLYSLCKRRGYIPHGESSATTDAETGKVLKALEANKEAFAEGNFRTIGEWLYSLPQSRNRNGLYDKCILHSQLAEEISTLFDTQRKLGNSFATEAMENQYVAIFDWEKPRAAFDEKTYSLVGNCVYFPQHKRAARCTLTNELVSAYAAFCNVSIYHLNQKEPQLLTKAQIDACISTLFSPTSLPGNKTCKVTYSDLRKTLDLPATSTFKGIQQEDEKNRWVFTPKGWQALRNSLKEAMPELTERLRDDRDLADAVFESVAYASTAPVLENRLSQLELSEEEVDALCENVPYSSRVLNGYGSRSKLALDMLFDAFEDEGVRSLTEAEKATGLDKKRTMGNQVPKTSRLMPYEQWMKLTGRTNNNPVVLRAMSQMRKVVNAVCNEWGVPHEIHVELDRELRLSKKKRQNIEKLNKKREKENQRIRETIADVLSCRAEDVRNKQVQKYRMWEEQDNFDAYTGEKIELERLLTDDTYTQIDHILPFSRTGENSISNKILVLASSNQLKREQTPYEWMTSGQPGAPSWEEFQQRVINNKHYWPHKRENLLRTEPLGEDESYKFLRRSITDTAYMSREIASYLDDCLDFPEAHTKIHVQPTAGRATGWLRHTWGLNFGEDGQKDRSDDRHHAVDACIIAACSISAMQLSAKFNKRGLDVSSEVRNTALSSIQPWETFAADVSIRRNHVIPTRYVPRKGRGELFEQTNYAYLGMNESGKHIVGTHNPETGKLDEKVAGNVRISEDGKSAVLVSEMLCLRLWLDKDARPNGKVKGQWYADPIYKSDISALREGTYVPKIPAAHKGKDIWKKIPNKVIMANKSIVLYRGMVLNIDGRLVRFVGYNINSNAWEFISVKDRKTVKMPTISQLGATTKITIVDEDILGRCWSHNGN